ncbi:uncharacterized protein K460DRAFT_396764 [Cucurbitaria berberidis CBS 394.84]|uniref:BZIP domain-containing protein n=1 Tax=Cucurbitaria berberidis CBS 394.84 TaxID=1168544 RepID=A0A9P4L667_9PLEO|nr:uncharacterized protein K460DRAFT_396764 [Cucurbitaria berberidis CBS 394.84]KAF1843470.1 hypothetical protein K460DRAFT_396764 [Cucurbitaria berberidis CBS 394.84]
MVRRTDPKDDDWQYVKDAKKRKQIQDRLAQRARRQRLRKAKLESTSQSRDDPTTQTRTPISSESNSSADEHLRDTAQLLISDNEALSLIATSSTDVVDQALESWGINPRPEDLVLDNPSAGILDLTDPSNLSTSIFAMISPLAQPNHPFTVVSALYINGEILGIPCSTACSSRTPAPTPSIPLPLHPTETQRLIVHPRWVDRLPFPKMRDNLITLQGVLDEEDFIRDIFTMPSWTITPGRACWDPRAWKMEKEWAGKWGWLMF